MFIVSITYTAPEPHITAQRPAHIQWLKDAFTRGNLKIAGSKTMKDGGILLSNHPDGVRGSLMTGGSHAVFVGGRACGRILPFLLSANFRLATPSLLGRVLAT